MDDEELQHKCDDTLDNDNLLEEDKIEQIEQIVDEFYGTKNWSVSDKERLVLDILWKHRNKRTDTKPSSINNNRRVKAKVIQNTISKPLIIPPPPDPSKLVPLSTETTNERSASSTPSTVSTPSTPGISEWNVGGNLPPCGNDGSSNETSSAELTQEEAMSPFDILRSILGEENSDEQIHHALQKSEFDIQATLSLLMSKSNLNESIVEDGVDLMTSPNSPGRENSSIAPAEGISSDSSAIRITNPYLSSSQYAPDSTSPGQEKIMCKYFLQFGECLRADCKYSHDLSSRICRFWLRGECLAGDGCAFLHEVPQQLLEKWSISDEPYDHSTLAPTPKKVSLTEEEFPALGAVNGGVKKKQQQQQAKIVKPAWGPSQFHFKPSATFIPSFQKDVNEFVPRIVPSTIAPVAATIPTPLQSPALPIVKPMNKLNRSVVSISTPKLIPWVTVEEYPDHEKYVTYRLAALRHGEMRNKYLQLAADRWNKNDAAGASALSKKGQKHNTEMIDAYTNASDLLYELRLSSLDNEIFIDLHGMELDESIDRLYEVLCEIEETDREHPRVVYAICGAGHHFSHSKKATDDKLSKHVKEFLDSKGYEWKEFKTTEKKFGKIIGIDPWSHI